MHAPPLPTGDEKRAAVRSMFDRIAPRYDLMNRLLTGGLDQRWRRLTLAAVDVGPGDVVVDVACGTGDLTEAATARGARAVGVDFSLGMLRGARRRGPGAWLSAQDAARLALADGAATVVVSGFALRNLVSVPAALAEMARVLGRGGRLALLEVDRPAGGPTAAVHAAYFDRFVPWLGGLLSDRSAYAYLPRSTSYLPAAPVMRRWIEDAGFDAVCHRRLLLGAAQLWTAVRP